MEAGRQIVFLQVAGHEVDVVFLLSILEHELAEDVESGGLEGELLHEAAVVALGFPGGLVPESGGGEVCGLGVEPGHAEPSELSAVVFGEGHDVAPVVIVCLFISVHKIVYGCQQHKWGNFVVRRSETHALVFTL